MFRKLRLKVKKIKVSGSTNAHTKEQYYIHYSFFGLMYAQVSSDFIKKTYISSQNDIFYYNDLDTTLRIANDIKELGLANFIRELKDYTKECLEEYEIQKEKDKIKNRKIWNI
jgi:hypothetical protein